MQDYNQALAYIITLTGSPDTVVDFRCINDRDKATPAHNYRGTLAELWYTLCDYNNRQYGIFCNINCMDGVGRELANVAHIRAHVVDLDNVATARASYDRAIASHPVPTFGVQTSPGKFHVYWIMEPYTGNEFYTIHQRKLRQVYDGDRSVIDPTRVLRVPGFYHLKGEAFMVNCWSISNTVTKAETMQSVLAAVNVIDGHSGRFPLGEPTMAAPSLEWLKFAMTMLDPNQLDRSEWLSFSAAIKQAGWNHADEATLQKMWLEWCAQYQHNNEGENLKLWNSVRDTEVGWPSIERKTPVKAYEAFGFKTNEAPPVIQPKQQSAPASAQEQTDSMGEILDAVECQQWFKDCYFINRTGEIFSRAGRFMNATKFNGQYGGKVFIYTSTGKTTDEAWKAALRSTVWTIPKVDHIRFLPDRPLFDIIVDNLGRKGLNTYIPARIDAKPGDVSMWLQHVAKILPNADDQKLFYDYLAHAVKYPGYKIPWAPLLQSAEGVGKTVFYEVMKHALGDMYIYSPKAQELIASGSKFNAWMRGKLMIIVNEIKVDERRELIEILKPMITDAQVEVQSKGVDQEMEDNPANWLLFSNHKDAIPVTKNGRRYAIFYSALSNAGDIAAAGMDKPYFDALWAWLREGGGLQAIAHWLLNYPIERGAIPVRAPETSSHMEALRRSRSPMEVLIAECVENGAPGFRGGFVSTLAVVNRSKIAGLRSPSTWAAQQCLESMGYVEIGRAPRPYAQESTESRATLYGMVSNLDVNQFGRAQGYE